MTIQYKWFRQVFNLVCGWMWSAVQYRSVYLTAWRQRRLFISVSAPVDPDNTAQITVPMTLYCIWHCSICIHVSTDNILDINNTLYLTRCVSNVLYEQHTISMCTFSWIIVFMYVDVEISGNHLLNNHDIRLTNPM